MMNYYSITQMTIEPWINHDKSMFVWMSVVNNTDVKNIAVFGSSSG